MFAGQASQFFTSNSKVIFGADALAFGVIVTGASFKDRSNCDQADIVTLLRLVILAENGCLCRPSSRQGVGRILFLDEKDRAITDFDLEDIWAPAVQAGFRWRIHNNWSANFDVRYAPFEADITGNLGPAPVQAEVEVDPPIVSIGVAYRILNAKNTNRLQLLVAFSNLLIDKNTCSARPMRAFSAKIAENEQKPAIIQIFLRYITQTLYII